MIRGDRDGCFCCVLNKNIWCVLGDMVCNVDVDDVVDWDGAEQTRRRQEQTRRKTSSMEDTYRICMHAMEDKYKLMD